MIRSYKNWILSTSHKLLDLAKRADYEYVCKKILTKHGFNIDSFAGMDELQELNLTNGLDPYLKRIRELWYNLKWY